MKRKRNYGPALYQVSEKLVPSLDRLEGAALMGADAMLTWGTTFSYSAA